MNALETTTGKKIIAAVPVESRGSWLFVTVDGEVWTAPMLSTGSFDPDEIDGFVGDLEEPTERS